MNHRSMCVAGALAIALAAPAVAAPPQFQSPLQLAAAKTPWAARATMTAAAATAGGRIVVAGQRGLALYSDDGKTWTQADVPVSSDLTALYFSSPKLGWAVGHEGVILHTADGGASWKLQLDGKQAADLVARAYAGSPSGGDATAERLRKDAETLVAQGADKPFLDVWFEDERKGYAVGAFNLILRTEDGGASWVPWMDRVDNPKALHFYAIRPAAGTVFIVGEQGLVLKLDRERQRFVAVSLPYQGTLFGVTGDAGSVLVYGLRGNALRSTDAGASWTPVNAGVAAGLTAGAVRADGSWVLASQAGHVLVSRDGGASFQQVQPATVAPVFGLAEAAPGTLALAGPTGVRIEAVK